MAKVRTLLGAVALALTIGVGQAATLLETDFTKGSTGWVLNGDAQLLDPQTAGISQVLALTTNDNSQTGVAWTELKQKVPSFSFIADIRVRFNPEGFNECPADGVTMAFAPVETDAMGGGGGSLGLYGGAIETFTAFEINTWRGAGLGNDDERGNCVSGKHETFAFGVVNPNYGDPGRMQDGIPNTPDTGGAKINQVVPPAGMKIVNGGFYRYQWNADGVNNTMSVYVTGLDENNKQFQKVKVLEVKFPKNPIDFEGRWGFTAATGGAVQSTDIKYARIDSPMIDPL